MWRFPPVSPKCWIALVRLPPRIWSHGPDWIICTQNPFVSCGSDFVFGAPSNWMPWIQKRLLWARWRHQIEQERVHVSFTKTRCQRRLLYWWAAGCWLEGQVSPSNGHQGCSGRQLVGTTMTPHQTTPLGFNHICPHSLSNATQLVTPSPMQSYYHHYIQSQEYRGVLTFWRTLGPLRITKLPAATTWYLRRPIFWFKLLSSHRCWWIGPHLSIISR